jgi:hypothetical protein
VSELPDRPNLDQLRRQAREVLRAAADGEPSALTRIRAISGRVSLSAAQLAVAREYGFKSWPALHAEVERRLAELPPREEGTGRAGTRWSFGGAAAIETAAGKLYPGGLVAGPGQAALDASLMPSGETQQGPATPPRDNSAREAWAHAAGNAMSALAEAISGAVELTDDQGTTYALRVKEMSGSPVHQGQERGLVSLRLEVDPVPARERGWLELRGQDGSAARLLPSAHPEVSVSRLAPVPDSPAARELSEQALRLIGLRLSGAGQEAVERQCSAALARAAEIQQSGEPGAAGDPPGHLARLCAVLTGHGPADGLPRGWSSMINAANRTDGAQQHLDVSAALPPVHDIVVRVDSLVSEPGSWKVYLRAEPGWWTYSADRHRKRAVMSVHAEDDLGGMYLSQFGGSDRHGDHEELTLMFLPRLNPLARALTLTFSRAGEQVTIELRFGGLSGPRRRATTCWLPQTPSDTGSPGLG